MFLWSFPIDNTKALIDTGACANTMSDKGYEELSLSCGMDATLTPSEVRKVKLA